MVKFIRRFSMIVLCVLLTLGNGTVQPARAGAPFIFTVDSTADLNDDILNSVCSVGAVSGGPCTLRGAIAEANAIAASMDVTINIPAGTYDLTIAPVGVNGITSGDLDFPVPNPGYTIRLIGTGAQPAVIDANQLDRVLYITSNVNVSLENIVIRGGLLSWTGEDDYADGAGILNYGNLSLNNVIIEENEARCGQATCEFQISGGGILNLGAVRMVDSTVRNNTSVAGSAIFNSGGSGYFFMKNSAVINNHAVEAGTINNYADMHMRNSTISNNTAGPMYIVGILNYKYLVIESSTIANAGTNSGVTNVYADAEVIIKDSILLKLTGAGYNTCQNNGIWTSQGYNIYSDDTCPATGAGDVINTDPMLGSLGYWGGTTMTMPLSTGSPAKDNRPGNCTTIPENPVLPPEPLLEDQRHYARSDGECDTGAFEGYLDGSLIFLPMIFR